MTPLQVPEPLLLRMATTIAAGLCAQGAWPPGREHLVARLSFSIAQALLDEYLGNTSANRNPPRDR